MDKMTNFEVYMAVVATILMMEISFVAGLYVGLS